MLSIYFSFATTEFATKNKTKKAVPGKENANLILNSALHISQKMQNIKSQSTKEKPLFGNFGL